MRQLEELGVDLDRDDLWPAAFDELSAMVSQLLEQTGERAQALTASWAQECLAPDGV